MTFTKIAGYVVIMLYGVITIGQESVEIPVRPLGPAWVGWLMLAVFTLRFIQELVQEIHSLWKDLRKKRKGLTSEWGIEDSGGS